ALDARAARDRDVDRFSVDAEADATAARGQAEIVADGQQVARRRVDDLDLELRGVAEAHAALAPRRRRERELGAQHRDGAGVVSADRGRAAVGRAEHERAHREAIATDGADLALAWPQHANRLFSAAGAHDDGAADL